MSLSGRTTDDRELDGDVGMDFPVGTENFIAPPPAGGLPYSRHPLRVRAAKNIIKMQKLRQHLANPNLLEQRVSVS